MRPAWSRSVWLMALVMLTPTLGCVHKPQLGSSLHADITDPVGDTVRDPLFRISPDLVHGQANVVGRKIIFTIWFAPGTFDRSTTRLTIQLDVDHNPLTGIATSTGLGIDYIVDMWAPLRRAVISKAVPGTCTTNDPCYLPIGAAPLTFVSDGMSVTLPLSRIGNDDGQLN